MGPVGIPSFPGRSGNVAGSLCGSSPPEPRPLPEVQSGTTTWFSDSTLLRAFSCQSCMSKSRWVTCILEMLSFFLEWRLPDSEVALMGVLVSGGLASGGSPSSARLTVGLCCLNTAQWEPTRGIPSRRPARRVS